MYVVYEKKKLDTEVMSHVKLVGVIDMSTRA